MPGIDEISARLAVLETVMRQLVTHLAVRADDPIGRVQTRKVLAQRVIQADGALPPPVPADRLRAAVAGFFGPVEHVFADYTIQVAGGTDHRPRR